MVIDTKQLELLRPLSLLYVEDDPAAREELAQMLELWFHRVEVAEDGRAGLAAYEANPPDIVVTDVQMPVLNGLAMAAEIRRRTPEQPVVVLSAHSDMEYLFRAIDIGIANYVTKPVNLENLLSKLLEIAALLKERKERRREQRLLEQYRQLVDDSAIVSKLDPGGRLTYVNDRFCALSGYPREELLGREMKELRHPDEPKDLAGSLWNGILAGQKWSGIVKNRARSGELFVVESNMAPILDAEEAVEEVICLDVDITDIYLNYEQLVETLGRSQRSLHEQRHFLGEYKRALELGGSICVSDASGRILAVNRQFAASLGQRPEDLQGFDLATLTPDDYAACFQEASRQMGDHCSRIMAFRHGDGSRRLFQVNVVAVRDLDGQVESLILGCQEAGALSTPDLGLPEYARQLLETLGQVAECRGRHGLRHVRRVGEFAALLAHLAGLAPEQAALIRAAAPLHDVGMSGVAEALVNKPGRLDAAEFEAVRAHARLGHEILSRIDHPVTRLAAALALEHHEQFAGGGYPRGLRGEEIRIEARILAVADVFDALSHDAPHRAAWDDFAIRAFFREQRGARFDPALVDLLFLHWREFTRLREDMPDESGAPPSRLPG